MYPIKPHRSKRFPILIKSNGVSYNIFDIEFHKRRGNESSCLIIFLPEFRKNEGLLSKIIFPKNRKKVSKISLLPGGKVTSHLVKYTHWQDGNTHFSQDGKIFTRIRNSSDKLTQSTGHIFTIMTKGFKGFRSITDDEKIFNDKCTHLEFDAKSEVPESVKFVARWYKKDVVHTTKYLDKPIYILKDPEGVDYMTWAISPHLEHPLSDLILLLSAKRIPSANKQKGSMFSFMGGFTEKSIRDDLSKDIELLVCLYPARNYKKLLNTIGSIDLDPTK